MATKRRIVESVEIELFAPQLPPAAEEPRPIAVEPTYSVSTINKLVLAALKQRFPQAIWVRGEVQGYDLRKHRDSVSFTLAEKAPDSDDVLATVTAILFGDYRKAIDAMLRQTQNSFQLQDGIEVRFRVEVDMWAKAGRYQLRVVGIDPTYTLGRLAQNRKRIIEQLTQRGLIEKNKSVSLPLVPLRVGVIGAEGSAGLRDFRTHLRESGYAFSMVFIDAAMQGEKVDADVSQAIERLNGRTDIDVIVITRGGGGATDLSWFDRLRLAEAIANSALPVLTGLGHTHDTSVADIVAHADLKTPTDAAQFLVGRVATFLDEIHEAARSLSMHAERLLDDAQSAVAESAQTICRATQDGVMTTKVWLADRQRDIVSRTSEIVSVQWQFLRGSLARVSPERITQMLRGEDEWSQQTTQRLSHHARNLVQRRSDELLQQTRACTYPRLSRLLSRETQWLTHTSATVSMLDPIKTLRRGFSIVRNADGTIVTSIAQATVGDTLATQVADGTIGSRVETVTQHEEESNG